MERHELLAVMADLHLSGMRAAYDEVMTDAIRRQHPVQRVLGDLLKAEVTEKQVRSIRYRLASAKLPLAKELASFDFSVSPVNAALVRDLHAGGLLSPPRNAVLVGGTGTGKTHLAIAIATHCIRNGARGRFFNVVDTGQPTRGRGPHRGRWPAGRAAYPGRPRRPRRAGLSALSPQRRPTALPPDLPPLRADGSRHHHQSRLRRLGNRLRRRQDDDRPAGSPDPPLRHRRDRQRKLALQQPQLTPPPDPHPGGIAQVGPQGYARACRQPVEGAQQARASLWTTWTTRLPTEKGVNVRRRFRGSGGSALKAD